MNNNEKKDISYGTFLLLGLIITLFSLFEIFDHDSVLIFGVIPFAEYPLCLFGIICMIVSIYELINGDKKKGK